MALSSRGIANLVAGLSAVLAVSSCALLYAEWRVARSAAMLTQEEAIIAIGEVPAVAEAGSTWLVPARAMLINSLRLARVAAVTNDNKVRRELLDRAGSAVAHAEQARPGWGEAVVGKAYVSALRHGEGAPETLRLVAESYRWAPILKGAAPWRVMVGFGLWTQLSPQTRRAVLDEGVWLSQQSFRDEQAVLDLARRSPAYLCFFLRWRVVRLHRAERLG